MTLLRSMALSSICFSLAALGLSAACSGERDRQREVIAPAEAAIESGRMSLALTARGESGSVYRLRNAFFQVNDTDFSFFQQFSTEDDPLATQIEASLPVGDYFIDLFGGFNLERIEPDGSIVGVQSTLLSPSSQTFRISANQETGIIYRFETSGEVVEFGSGRLVIDIEVTERAGESRRTVIETSQDALAGLTLRDTLAAALRNGGVETRSAEDVYHALIDSYNGAPGRDPSLAHCDDVLTGGQPSLNGFPLQCPRLEGEQFDNLDSWFALAFVNRLDLAPTDGSNCGQQRVIFANSSFIGAGRMFIILEAEIPNPAPECGVSSCRPIAELWESLAEIPDGAQRGQLLRDAFLTTGTGPIAPFMNSDHLGPAGGQIRTNNFNDFQWTLREFQLQPEPQVLPVQTSVGESPNGELWNDRSGLPQTEECQQSFLDALPHLLSDNLATLAFPVAEACEDAESPNDFFRQDYAFHLSSGSGDFIARIDEAVQGTGLGAFDIAQRARFAGSCMGCHIESGGAGLGRGLTAPFQNDFVQVSELALEPCAGGGTCFGISDALRRVFLPHRIEVQRNFLAASGECSAAPPGAADAGAPASAARAAPVRTLGGQPVVEHAH